MVTVRQLRTGLWRAKSYGGLDPLTRKKRWLYDTFDAPDRDTARRRAERWEDDLRAGDATANQGTFGQLLDRWFAVGERRWSPTNRRQTRHVIGAYLTGLRPLPVGGPNRIRTETLDVFYAELERRGGDCTHRPCPRQPCAAHAKPWCNRVRCDPLPCPHDGACADWTPCTESPCPHGGPLSPATVARIHNVVRGALNQAVAWEWIARNPAEHVTLTQVDEPEVAPPTVAEVIALLAAAEAEDPALAVFLLVAAVTGARRGALCALRWSDLDLAAGTITFPRVTGDGPDGIEIVPATRRKHSGHGALDPYTVAAITGHRTRMLERAIACGTAFPADALVFTDDPAGALPWRPDTTTKRVARIRRRTDLEHMQLRQLRDFMATQLINAGVNPKTVAERGGWRIVETMFRRYTRSLPPSDQAAADTIGGLLAGG